MDSGKWAPAVQIKGYRWNKLTHISAILSAISTNEITYTPSDSSFDDGASVFGQGGAAAFGEFGKVILGPSTYVSNIGAMEILDVISGSDSAHIVVCKDEPAYTYSVGDPITLIGLGAIPGAWSGLNNIGYCQLAAVDDAYSADPFTFVWQADGTSCSLWQKLPVMFGNKFLRLSVMINMDTGWTSGGTLKVYLADKDRVEISGTAITITDAAKGIWTEYTKNLSITTSGVPEDRYVMISSTSETFAKARIAGIALCCTDQYDSLTVFDYISSSPYNLDSVSKLGGIRINRFTEGGQFKKDFNGRYYIDKVMNQNYLPVPRYEISYDLTEVTDSEWDELQRLILWQKNGGLINHFPHIDLAGLPYYMTGRIKLNTSRKHRITNLDRQSFRLTFTEVNV